MKNQLFSIASRLTDQQLLVRVNDLARCEREATVNLVVCLAELDERKLYLGEGCASLFSYCVKVLHLSEHAAYGRIQAARVTRKFPAVVDKLVAGSVNLTTLVLLSPHLTKTNCPDLLAAAEHKSKRQVAELLAALSPRPEVAASIRKVPSRSPAPGAPPVTLSGGSSEVSSSTTTEEASAQPDLSHASAASAAAAGVACDTGVMNLAGLNRASGVPGMPGVLGAAGTASTADPARVNGQQNAAARETVTPLAPDRYKIQFTMSAAMHAKLREAQELIRHQIPNGDPAAVIDRALTLLVAHLKKATFGDSGRRARKPAATRQAAEQPQNRQGAHQFRDVAKAPQSSESKARKQRGSRADERPRRKRRSRYIPVAVRRTVWARDGGRCAFTTADGRRCDERSFLQFHHDIPHGDNGAATIENIQLRCRAHNFYEADLYFGPGTSAIRGRKAENRQRDGTGG